MISKKTVVGVADQADLEIQTLVRSLGMLYVNLDQSDQSDLEIPPIQEETAPIVYELLDSLIVWGNLEADSIQRVQWAMASGTLLVVPRTTQWMRYLGKGALYYQMGSLRELQACLEILSKSEQKRQEIRQAASNMFQKRYSYTAIARAWQGVLEQVSH